MTEPRIYVDMDLQVGLVMALPEQAYRHLVIVLRRIPQDPGGLLRRKFQYQYQRFGVDQDGNSVLGDAQQKKPW